MFVLPSRRLVRTAAEDNFANDIAIVSIKGNDYRIHFWYMSKNNAIAVMTNSDLNDKNGIL